MISSVLPINANGDAAIISSATPTIPAIAAIRPSRSSVTLTKNVRMFISMWSSRPAAAAASATIATFDVTASAVMVAIASVRSLPRRGCR
jgi:hypothetical protein